MLTVAWDSMPDINGSEESVASNIDLGHDQFKTKYKYGWTVDIDV